MPRKWCGCRADLQRVDRDRQRAVGAVLEADRRRQPARHLAVGLRFGRARADRGPRDQVRQVLRHDRVERLGGSRHAEIGQPAEQLARGADALLDVEGVVEIRVVDQALPAHRGARLLEVDPHDQQHRVLDARGQLAQSQRVLAGRRRIVDRARSDHDEQARVLPIEHAAQRLAAGIDEVFSCARQRQPLLDLIRCRQQFAGRRR